MFNLEQAISEWRQNMLAGGIKTPVPLEELESHLRDDIERETRSGLSEEDAFNSAVQKIGQPVLLKKEFSRAGGVLGWFGNDRTARINRILGTLWMAETLWSLIVFMPAVLNNLIHFQSLKSSPFFLFSALVCYPLSIFGSVSLFRGADVGRSIIKVLALLGATGAVLTGFHFGQVSLWMITNTIFNLVTVWLLRSPHKPQLASK